MKRSSAIWLGATLVVAVGVWGASYRTIWSCVWAARDVSHLSLRGRTKTLSCVHEFIGRTEVVLSLDSAAVAQAAVEAKRLGYRRTEPLTAGDAMGSSLLVPYIAKPGWYLSTMGKNSNGGFTVVVLDSTLGVLHVANYPN